MTDDSKPFSSDIYPEGQDVVLSILPARTDNSVNANPANARVATIRALREINRYVDSGFVCDNTEKMLQEFIYEKMLPRLGGPGINRNMHAIMDDVRSDLPLLAQTGVKTFLCSFARTLSSLQPELSDALKPFAELYPRTARTRD